jgi:hypothetical protein
MKRSDLKNQKPSQQGAAEELDEVNARTVQRGPDRARRKIEANIEAKAKQRRKREAPTSSALKKF